MFYIVTFLVFSIDIALKRLAVLYLAPVQSIPVIKGVLSLTYVQNTGVAFGYLRGQRPLLILIGVLVCVIVIYFNQRLGQRDILLKLCLAVILGGSLGNLYDRVFWGYVVDYIDFRVFPVFNFADISINAGVFLILMELLLRRPECTR